MVTSRLLRLTLIVAASCLLIGWTPKSQISLGLKASSITPRDFARQLERHKRVFQEGLMEPFRTSDPVYHHQNPDGKGKLRAAILQEVKRTIAMIEQHRPFEEIVRQAGVVTHYIHDANNPLNCSSADPQEGTYYADYLKYMQSAEPRLEVLFYGLSPELERGDVGAFIDRTLERCRKLYPLVGNEYRRVGKLPGTRYFDDRSTAFGIAGVSTSRAVSDAALILRYIWIEAGGADWRSPPKEGSGRLFRLPKD